MRPKPVKPSSPPTPASGSGELALIERIRRRAQAAAATRATTGNIRDGSWGELELGIGDDCAILRPNPGEELVVTTDFCLENRHWRRDWNSPTSVGHRTLARGLSDIAAMGARPVAIFLSLALPAPAPGAAGPPHFAREAFLDGFLDGLLTLATEHGVPLAGGDTSESPSEHMLADIVVLGAVPSGTALRRSGAQAGDLLYCTGTLGGSFAERHLIAAQASSATESGAGPPATTPSQVSAATRSAGSPHGHPFLFPQPRLAAGRSLRSRSLASACMDLSDGLSTDLRHLCDASAVAAEVDLALLPSSPWLRKLPAGSREQALLHGGEDYDLLFTAPASATMPPRLGGVRISCIGTITPRRARRPVVTLLASDGTRTPLEPGGWEHLR